MKDKNSRKKKREQRRVNDIVYLGKFQLKQLEE
jgi:hypothetical protein